MGDRKWIANEIAKFDALLEHEELEKHEHATLPLEELAFIDRDKF